MERPARRRRTEQAEEPIRNRRSGRYREDVDSLVSVAEAEPSKDQQIEQPRSFSMPMPASDFTKEEQHTKSMQQTDQSAYNGIQISARKPPVKQPVLRKQCVRCNKRGVLLALNEDGLCSECREALLSEYRIELQRVQAELQLIKDALSPEGKEFLTLERKLEFKKQAFLELNERLDIKQDELQNVEKAIIDAQKQLLIVDDAVAFETFALYEPQYSFCKSEEYKLRLDIIRKEQKELIKARKAVTGSNMTLDGSAKEGQKMMSDMTKLYLRVFNNECDVAVSSVKFNNFERCINRIDKTLETITKLGRSLGIRITPKYYSLKIDELHLAFEYQQVKEQEKEDARALREQKKEDAKVAAEIAQARAAAEKEKQHYAQAIQSLNRKISSCSSDAELAVLLQRKEEIELDLAGVNIKLSDIDYRQANQRAGYVYIISNIGSFGEDIYKIGMTRRLEPMDRVRELGDASVPYNFDVHAMIFSNDAPKLESALHRAFEHRRLNRVNTRREYFAVTLDEIKKVVRENHDKSVEFTDMPAAEQYREAALLSQKFRTASL